MEDLQDATECGVRCELSGDHCDFFTTDNGKCHLGRYDHWDSGAVTSTTVPITYHKHGNKLIHDPSPSDNCFSLIPTITLGQIQWVQNDNFKSWSSGIYWYKW